MSRHRTIWNAAHPHGGREGAAEERACVGYLGADVNSPHSKGTLPVYWAAHVETVKVLVEVGADTEALMTVDGMDTKITALQLAAFVRASWTRYASYL
jgi:hypothetical protein